MAPKLTADQMRRVTEVEEFVRVVHHLTSLVKDLEANRAAPARVVEALCGSIAREMSQLRQRTLTKRLGTIPDIAGALSVMAGRGGGLAMKIRGLSEGVSSLAMQLDHELKAASTPTPTEE